MSEWVSQYSADDHAESLSEDSHPHDVSDDQSAPSQLGSAYARYFPKLKAALLKSFGSGPPDPEDVIQQAFQNLLERKDRSDIKDVRAFLWRTARNLTLQEKRKAVVHSKYDFEIEHLFFPLGGDNSTPESILSTREELKIINQVLEQMPPRRRRAFVLHKIDGLTVSEVARRLKIARNPAQKHIAKAMRDIAVALINQKRDSRR
ncbi:MAG: sigma-70 family RNA polymerase sigma factor [Pseudomonadota bacterium]